MTYAPYFCEPIICANCQIWEDKAETFLEFERDPLAHIVENNLVIESLRLVAEKAPNPVTIEYDTYVDAIDFPSLDQPDQLARVLIRSLKNDSSRVVETNLVVGADGMHSKVRQAAQLQAISWDHGQSAVVATLCKREKNEPFTAWQRFVPNGPIALLPVSHHPSFTRHRKSIY
ncbi:Coenzyme Q6 monooxygenase [Fasciolopsis buskii]|uniref:Coenzyme Q6 monooxygenase n=1 Tax=Fasciolopsis buskii TaxID=27845 RepID=A0A8E0RUY0_9TREM|nr:Coenzyme Q6 monooxygenase [Fasciolopsis buski]